MRKIPWLLMFVLFLAVTFYSSAVCYANGVELKTGPFLGKVIQSNDLPRPVMVMIDNIRQARPQAGLDDASIVYEFLVEGGVTRFLALFYEKFPERVGPIRSTRAYCIQLAQEYNALLMHVGASPKGYHALSVSHIDHLDQLEDQSYYWRDSSHEVPSNIFTIKAVPEFLRSNQPTIKPPLRFTFQTGLAGISGTAYIANNVDVHYWGGYTVNYQYDEDRELYQRLHNGEPHTLESGKCIYIKNILIQFVETNVIDEEGHLDMKLTGTGKAIYCKEGFAMVGTWVKQAGKLTVFLDENGNEWKISPGQTWVQIIPSTSKVEYH